MAETGSSIVELHDDFYKDSFVKVVMVIIGVCIAILSLMSISLYLYLSKPAPVTFNTDIEWRVQADVPVSLPYVSEPDLLQWVSEAIQNAFVYDFNNYDDQLKHAAKYFTTNGWKVFLDQLNNYANYNTVQTNKLFVNATPSGAPYIIRKGLLSGQYAWWVQMPVDINYTGYQSLPKKSLILQILIVRISTMNN